MCRHRLAVKVKVTNSGIKNSFEFTTFKHNLKVAPNAISHWESCIHGNYDEFRTQQKSNAH
jgi:hypothetical protein